MTAVEGIYVKRRLVCVLKSTILTSFCSNADMHINYDEILNDFGQFRN